MAPDELSKLLYGTVTWMVISAVQTICSAEDPLEHETRAQRDARMLRSFRFWADTLASAALAAILVYWCRVLAGEDFLADRPTGGIVFWGVALVIASFVLQFVWWAVVTRAGRVRSLLVLLPVFLLVFVLPAALEYRDYQKSLGLRREAVMKWNAAWEAHGQRWYFDIRRAGLLGRPGLLPPMLEVQDRGRSVTIQNLAASPVCVRVARANADVRCVLDTQRHEACTVMEPGSRQEFTWQGDVDFSVCRNLPLDFRVGDGAHAELLWWSPVGLSQAEGLAQAEQRLRQLFADGGEQDPSIRRRPLQEIEAETRRLLALADDGARLARWKAAAVHWRAREQQQLWQSTGAIGDLRQKKLLRGFEMDNRERQIPLLRQTSATAAPGVIPPMLEVRDQLSLVRVRNRGEEPLVVRVTRRGSRLSLGRPFICFSHLANSERDQFAGLDVGGSATFLITQLEACEPIDKAPLEFEIRDRQGELIWASSSVLERLEQEALGWVTAQ